MELTIDVENGRVSFGSHERRNQWVDFYAVLAITRLDSSSAAQFISADAISRVGPWRHKESSSVGKEVARHLIWLDKRSLDGLLANQGKTKAWRLCISATAIHLRPDEAAVRAWVESRSIQPVVEHGWVDDLQRLVAATVALQEGQSEKVLQDLEEPLSDGAEPPLQAWAALIRGRAAFQYDDDDLLVRLHDDWFKRADGPGRTVGAKLRALIAFRNRFEHSSDALRSLSRLAAELELHGDTAALGSVMNVMGMLMRRQGNPGGAMMHHMRAVALLGISGDYPSLEGTLFNLANCRREMLQKEGLPRDDTVFLFVEMARAVCRRFTVGRNSAQIEVAAAQWAFEAKNPEKARYYLREAEALVEKIDNAFEQACFHYARARIEHDFPDGSSDPIKDLRIAERKFAAIGDMTALKDTRRMLKIFQEESRDKRSL